MASLDALATAGGPVAQDAASAESDKDAAATAARRVPVTRAVILLTACVCTASFLAGYNTGACVCMLSTMHARTRGCSSSGPHRARCVRGESRSRATGGDLGEAAGSQTALAEFWKKPLRANERRWLI